MLFRSVDGVLHVTAEIQELLQFGQNDPEIPEFGINPNQLRFVQPDLSDITLVGDGVSINYDHLELTSVPKLPRGKFKLSLMCNNITSLEGLHEGVTELNVHHNKLENLIGLPRSVTKLIASDNNLTSLEGLHEGVKHVSVDGFSEEDIENAKRGIYTTRMQESMQLGKLIKQYLLMH